MYGLGNWAEVAEHVGTKTKEQCIEHYTTVYMKSPLFPLPVWHIFTIILPLKVVHFYETN